MNLRSAFLFSILISIITIFACNTCEEVLWHQDADFDGLGNAEVSQMACEKPSGFVSNNTDPDDNCNLRNWYYDKDNDGYGDKDSTIQACDIIADFVANNDDPDDSDPTLTPENVWQGLKTVFTKPNNANWRLAANQDRITDSVWITRANSSGLFNIATDSIYNSLSPKYTQWAFGSTNRIDTLNFANWNIKMNGCPECYLDQPMVVYLTYDQIYIDIKFKNYINDSDGYGGVVYERSTRIF